MEQNKKIECWNCHETFTMYDPITKNLRENLIRCKRCAAQEEAKTWAQYQW